MKTYTYTEARQQLAGLLDEATREGRKINVAETRVRPSMPTPKAPAKSKKRWSK